MEDEQSWTVDFFGFKPKNVFLKCLLAFVMFVFLVSFVLLVGAFLLALFVLVFTFVFLVLVAAGVLWPLHFILRGLGLNGFFNYGGKKINISTESFFPFEGE